MIKNFINQLMLLVDSGKLLKSPIKWLYALIGALNFVPFLAFLYFWFKYWNDALDFLLPNFWGEFVTIFMLILFAYVLLLNGWILFTYWINRMRNLDAVVETGSRTTAIPLVTDIIQCSGEAVSLYVVLVPTFGAILAYIACLLTNGYEFYSEFNCWWMTLALPGVFIAVCLVGYINLLLTRFLAERLRLLAQIGNDVHKLAIGAKKEAPREADLSSAKFSLPAITRNEKLVLIWSVVCAAIVAFIVALTLTIITSVMFNKPISQELSDNQVHRLSFKYQGFSSLYYDARGDFNRLSEEKQEPYKDITYKRLYKYNHKYFSNQKFHEEVAENARANYEAEVHQPAVEKVKAEVAKWEQFKVDHDVTSYLTVTGNYGIGIEKKGKKEYDRPSYWFTLEMPRGEIKDASVTYRPKNEAGKPASGVNPITTNLAGLNKYTAEAPALYKSAKPELWNNYSISSTINSITLMDGSVIRPSDIRQIPKVIVAYNEKPNEKNEMAVIYKFVDNKYPSVDKYIKACLERELEARDKLCYEFLK
ncbi:MAG: hypothetical protein J5612_04430 [Paludibacteraceae bacterium]|nr:hypothetical protein [Paludibacteraceae bacterium]